MNKVLVLMYALQTQRLAETEAEIWHQQRWLPARAAERRGNDRQGEVKDELLFTSGIPLQNHFLSSSYQSGVWTNTFDFVCVRVYLLFSLSLDTLTVVWKLCTKQRDGSRRDV